MSDLAIETWLESKKDELCALLPQTIQKERFLRNIVMQIKMNPALHKCSTSSIAKACVQASTLGLDIGVLGSAYLVPYGNEAQLSIGYQGYIDLAYRSGLKAIHTGIVRQNDDYKATATGFSHDFDPFDSNRGPVVGVYCLVELPTGATYSELMTSEEVEQIRSGSRSANSPAWRDHWGEMAKKVVIRRALKRAPLSVETKEAIDLSDKAEFGNGKPQPVEPKIPLKEKITAQISTTKAENSIWDKHLERANALSKTLGFKRWNKITTPRQTMLKQRIKEEGFNLTDVEGFWKKTDEAFMGFDHEKVKDWSKCDLDILLRVPKKGNPDHYQTASEGGFKNEKQSEPVDVKFSITDVMNEE
jgi:recombination protein RecT